MRRVILAVVSTATALVFLLSFKTHTSSAFTAAPIAQASLNPLPSSAPASASSPKASSKPSARGKASASSAAPASSAPPAASAAKTVTGNVAWTQYGPVQVQVTVQNGKIIRAAAVQYPTQSPRDQQINSYAIPKLNSEAVAASSAQIDSVSGATYTSGGYINSLQSAVNKAGL